MMVEEEKMRVRKIAYDGERVTVHFERPCPGKTDVWDRFQMESREEPHPGLKEALAALAEHVVEVAELPADQARMIDARGAAFSWSQTSQGEVMGATIMALKRLARNRCPLVVNTPHTFEAAISESDTECPVLSDACAGALHTLALEAEAYVDGKRAQGNLFEKAADAGGAAAEKSAEPSECSRCRSVKGPLVQLEAQGRKTDWFCNTCLEALSHLVARGRVPTGGARKQVKRKTEIHA